LGVARGRRRCAAPAPVAGAPPPAAPSVPPARRPTSARTAATPPPPPTRHCFWDTGTLLANLLAVAAAREVPARVVAGFVDRAVEGLLDLDPRREAAIALVPLGHTRTRPGPAPEPPPLGLHTIPLSAHEGEYPAMHAAHQA